MESTRYITIHMPDETVCHPLSSFTVEEMAQVTEWIDSEIDVTFHYVDMFYATHPKAHLLAVGGE